MEPLLVRDSALWREILTKLAKGCREVRQGVSALAERVRSMDCYHSNTPIY